MNSAAGIGVIAPDSIHHALELLGDARELADRVPCGVSVLTANADAKFPAELIARGADEIAVAEQWTAGPNHRLACAQTWMKEREPRAVFAGADGDDRVLAARLAASMAWKFFAPVLSVTLRNSQWQVTALHSDGRRAQQIALPQAERILVTLRAGVAQPMNPDPHRRGTVTSLTIEPKTESVQVIERRPADPATTDIVHLPRLVSGGRGLGGPEGFALLRQVAERLDAGIAASRMAVDLGWIERERQVGQTGKTVSPELYLACGISGASHHREGMSDSRHIVALNNDPAAPIFQLAHLGLVADWRETLERFLELTADKER
jgi:electron transfer flavoprotein alpha subunit